MGSVQTKEYNSSDDPTIKNPDWMSSLPDTMSLQHLSIPGTHSSVVFYGGNMFQTQTWHLSKQYEAGIRYVDIHCRHHYNTLPVHDGIIYQHQTLDNIFLTTIDFLRNHSREIILMHIKEEFEPEGNSQDFFSTVDNYMTNAGKSWFWISSIIPSVGEARGKIIILQNYDGPEMGINYNTLNISDDFHVPTLFDIGKKWFIVERHLNEAYLTNFDELYLTVCAGGSSGAYPYSVAGEINGKLYNYLASRSHEKLRYGIIAINYPGSELIQLIIRNQPDSSTLSLTASLAIPDVPLPPKPAKSNISSTTNPKKGM
uniref:1-phosphatidylinositol phosphodiesterase-like n=1 Tax=Geotrypetes seraphini TaxID=260995 RepID=A0A6P8RCU0_GEOSA|nr:1-phosphatidylinositol phosphodiesterase-like [Geotrypetes seraphini]